VWTQASSGALAVGHPVTLTYANGEGLEFRRTIAIDDNYLFTIKDEVANKSDKAVSLFPFALISRHGTPKTLGYYILHEGLIGKFGDEGSKEVTYKTIDEKKINTFNATNAWLGITDKYWAAVLLPKTDAHVIANFRADMLEPAGEEVGRAPSRTSAFRRHVRWCVFARSSRRAFDRDGAASHPAAPHAPSGGRAGSQRECTAALAWSACLTPFGPALVDLDHRPVTAFNVIRDRSGSAAELLSFSAANLDPEDWRP